MKTKLFQNFSAPDIFTELTGIHPIPNMTCEEFKAKVNEWLADLNSRFGELADHIFAGHHDTVYYAMLTYRQIFHLSDYCDDDGKDIPIDDLPLLKVASMLSNTIGWMQDLAENEIKPLTPEQQDLWLEKSGNRFWCYENGNVWCD